MFYKQEHFRHSFVIVVVFSLVIVGCTKEEVISNSNEEIPTNTVESLAANGNSAAVHIAASEKLEILAAVAIPENLPNSNTRVATFYAVGVQKYKAILQ